MQYEIADNEWPGSDVLETLYDPIPIDDIVHGIAFDEVKIHDSGEVLFLFGVSKFFNMCFYILYVLQKWNQIVITFKVYSYCNGYTYAQIFNSSSNTVSILHWIAKACTRKFKNNKN